jgi:hypothetical protein
VPRCVFCKQSQFPSLFNNFNFKYEFRYFPDCDDEEYCFLGCEDVKSATNLQMFRGNKQPSSSVSLASTFTPDHTTSHTTVKYLVASPH